MGSLDNPQGCGVDLGVGEEYSNRRRLKFPFLRGFSHLLVRYTAAPCVAHQTAEVTMIGGGNFVVQLVPGHSMGVGESGVRAANYAHRRLDPVCLAAIEHQRVLHFHTDRDLVALQTEAQTPGLMKIGRASCREGWWIS